MKIKKTTALILAALIAVSASTGVSYAAKGGARISAPKISTPKTTSPSTNTPKNTAPSNDTVKDSPNTKDYAPSKKASEYDKTAPNTNSNAKSNTKSNTNSNTNPANQSGSRWGSALRNIGLFAGGMMLGSLLSNMFGFGMGSMMSDIFGLLVNAFVIFLVFMFIKFLWNKLRGNKTSSNNYYQQSRGYNSYDDPRNQTINVTPQYDDEPIQDIKPPSGRTSSGRSSSSGREYDPKDTADRYRKM